MLNSVTAGWFLHKKLIFFSPYDLTMKKLLPLLIGMFFAISAIGQNQSLKNPIPSYKKFMDQTVTSKLYEELKVDSIINESWNSSDSTFTNSNKDTYQYSNGKNVGAAHYNWDNTSGEWVPSFKNDNSFGTNGMQILEIYSNWDASASEWKQVTKSVQNRDQNGKDTLTITYNWNTSLNDWVSGSKYITHFTDEGNQTYFLMCQWNAEHSNWDSVIKSDIYLNETGIDTVEISSFWDSNTSQWNATNKSKSFLNENGLDTLTCQYHWSADLNDWVMGQRAVSEYTIDGMDSVVSVYGWNEVENQWYANFRFEMRYDEDKSYVDQFMGIDNEWQFFSTITTYYSEYLPTGISKVSDNPGIYPNPAREFIVIDMPVASDNATIQLFSLQGRKVLDQKVTDGKQISTNDLPKGLYLYKITSNGNGFSGKLVIE
jgi:hypothetical protein